MFFVGFLFVHYCVPFV